MTVVSNGVDRTSRPPVVDADQALAMVGSGMTVFVHTAAAAPAVLTEALARRASDLEHVEVVHLHTEGPAPYADEALADRVKVRSLFVGANLRSSVASGSAEYVPVFLSEIPTLFRSGALPVDVALVQVSPPDRHGWCTLGVSVDVSKAAVDTARIVIGQVNPQMPRCHGDGMVHISCFSALVECETELPVHPRAEMSDVEQAIGRHVAGLVPDGATLQMGIGGVPDAVLSAAGRRC